MSDFTSPLNVTHLDNFMKVAGFVHIKNACESHQVLHNE